MSGFADVQTQQAAAFASEAVLGRRLAGGLGLLAGAEAVTVEKALTSIGMKRGSTGITGALAYKLAGIPVYWRSLDGLTRLEWRNYGVLELRPTRSMMAPRRTVQRLYLLDYGGNTMAWSSCTAVLNEGESLQQFLSFNTPSYSFLETSSARRGDRFIDMAKSIAISATLIAAGELCVTAGLFGLFRRFSAKLLRSKSR